MAKGVTREAIVDAALDALDERGIDGLTLRAVADRLGVRPPALYWHVRNKQELLDEMGTTIQKRVLAQLKSLDSQQDWAAAMAAYAHVLREEYRRHRDGARTFAGTRLTDPEALRQQEPWFAWYVERGWEMCDLVAALELITAFVVGFVIEEQERSQSADRYSLQERDAALADAPLVRAAGAVLWGEPDQRFAERLATLIAGVAARSAPTGGQPPVR